MTGERSETPRHRRWRAVVERGTFSAVVLGTLLIVNATLVEPRWETFNAGQVAAAWTFLAVHAVLSIAALVWVWRAFRAYWWPPDDE